VNALARLHSRNGSSGEPSPCAFVSLFDAEPELAELIPVAERSGDLQAVSGLFRFLRLDLLSWIAGICRGCSRQNGFGTSDDAPLIGRVVLLGDDVPGEVNPRDTLAATGSELVTRHRRGVDGVFDLGCAYLSPVGLPERPARGRELIVSILTANRRRGLFGSD
jgi:hypothetical protein